MKDKADWSHLEITKRDFLEYTRYDREEAERRLQQIFSVFDLKEPHENHINTNILRETGRFIEVIDEAKFKLSEQLLKSGIITPKVVTIYFINFSKISEFNVKDVDKFFDDIYYPGANDIMISDRELSWMFYIDHDCGLYEFSSK